MIKTQNLGLKVKSKAGTIGNPVTILHYQLATFSFFYYCVRSPSNSTTCTYQLAMSIKMKNSTKVSQARPSRS